MSSLNDITLRMLWEIDLNEAPALGVTIIIHAWNSQLYTVYNRYQKQDMKLGDTLSF